MRRWNRLVVVAFAMALAAGVALAPRQQPVYAQQCGGVIIPGGCLSGNTTMAGVVVYHKDLDDTEPAIWTPVEPDDTDSWQLTALYSTDAGLPPPTCQCINYNVTATADVTWTGTGWSVSCTGCGGPILSVSVCSEAGCASEGFPSVLHGHAYRLVARVSELRTGQCMGYSAFLRGVTFATTAVDDGDKLDDDCIETDAVSPISQSWSDTDFAMGCIVTCSSVIGPQIDIIYD
jgi:hypothetical protein